MAKAVTSIVTYDSLVREIKSKHFRPVYYLMGQGAYFIDQLAKLIVAHSLTEDERAFNLITLFGTDTDMGAVINAVSSFPMGAERMVVLVREAQHLSNLDLLTHYLANPQPNNILVFCHKNGTLDRRKKVVAQIEKHGVVFESKKIYENQLPAFITSYLKAQHYTITPDGAEFLSSCVGTDLHRIVGELDKLIIAINNAAVPITSEHIEAHIGISKSYNNFELQNALSARDVFRANQIINYFERNAKDNPIQLTLIVLYKHFSALMLAHYAPDKSPHGLAAWLGMSEWQVKQNVLPALDNFSAVKVMHTLSLIRRCDARAKGVDNPSTDDAAILRELVYYILH